MEHENESDTQWVSGEANNFEVHTSHSVKQSIRDQ